jgi:hypothetical protein
MSTVYNTRIYLKRIIVLNGFIMNDNINDFGKDK